MGDALLDGLRAQGRGLGFDYVGACDVTPGRRASDAYRTWLAAGMAGEMGYLERADRVLRALDPGAGLPWARSLVVAAANYHTGHLAPAVRDDPSRGIIASYAWGADYHDVLLRRLTDLARWLSDIIGRPVTHRPYVDFGPVLERDAAARAGLGFIGRNTMLIDPRRGAWTFLGVLAVDADLVGPAGGIGAGTTRRPDDAGPTHPTDPTDPTDSTDPLDPAAPPGTRGACGSCTRCLDACPTAAFPRPYVLDARRCISYLTIELKGPIPLALRPAIGNRIFGCDICNDVCPYNRRFARATDEPAFSARPDQVAPPLLDLVELDEAAFARRFAGTALARARRRGLVRNVCVALGNWADPAAVLPLGERLRDVEPLVRGHAAWGLGRIGSDRARAALRAAGAAESDPWVAAEIAAAVAAD